MQIRLLTNGIELWKWKVWNKLSSFDNPCPSFLCPFLWTKCSELLESLLRSKKASLQIFFRSLPMYMYCWLLSACILHIFKFEQHGLCQFCAGLQKWQKDYFVMTRPISTLYLMLSLVDDILSRKSSICETFRLRCSSYDKSPRIWFNNVI